MSQLPYYSAKCYICKVVLFHRKKQDLLGKALFARCRFSSTIAQEGILSSIIYGPDRRTQIRSETQQVLFTVYAPPGIAGQLVCQHLQDIRDYVRLVAPEAQVTWLDVRIL